MSEIELIEKNDRDPNEEQTLACPPVTIQGRVFCDDFVDVYLGSKTRLRKKLLSAKFAAGKSNPFESKAECCDWLYFVCWSNHEGENGFLAELQGSNTILSGSSDWEVLPTSNSTYYPSSPPINAVNLEMNASTGNWIPPFKGQPNNGSVMPFPYVVSGISSNANFIWHDSGRDLSGTYPSSQHAPFRGFDHDEFLIFRIPVAALHKEKCQDCNCKEKCCGPCETSKDFYNLIGEMEVEQKEFVIPGDSNNPQLCGEPYAQEPQCQSPDFSFLKPCFFLHWGDGPSDQIETHDTEIGWITICNPYKNVSMKGISFSIDPPESSAQTPDGEPLFDFVPGLMEIGCLPPCSCVSRKIAIITRGIQPGIKHIDIDYCIGNIEIHGQENGRNRFTLDIKKS